MAKISHGKNTTNKERLNEFDRREGQQRQTDEMKVTPEITYKALTEESYQEIFKEGFTALTCTAIRVPPISDKAISNLMRVCDGILCVKAVLTK